MDGKSLRRDFNPVNQEQEDRMLAAYWGVVEEESEDGFAKEQSHLMRQYYLRRLGMLAVESDGEES